MSNASHPRILSPMPTGSGAIVVHQQLQERLDNYEVATLDPLLTLLPQALPFTTRRQPADLIHTAPDYGSFVARDDCPLVVTFHNLVIDDYMRDYSSPLQNLHYRYALRGYLQRALRRADVVTAVSQFTASLVHEELGFEAPIEVITNGVDTGHFTPAPRTASNTQGKDNSTRILFAGNPTTRKGAHWLTAIAEGLDPGIEILVTGGLRGSWKKKLQHRNISTIDKVEHRKMPDLYRSVDALLLPTVREGDSLAVLEAMSCGLPVVATDCSSLPERVSHEQGGLLCPPGDHHQFSQALNRLNDPTLRKSMGEFNRQRAEDDFDLQGVADRYRAVFSTVLEKSGHM